MRAKQDPIALSVSALIAAYSEWQDRKCGKPLDDDLPVKPEECMVFHPERYQELCRREEAARQKFENEYLVLCGIASNLSLPRPPKPGDNDWENSLQLWSVEAFGRSDPVDNPAPKKNTDASHSPDFRSVHWYGFDYLFTPTQAACVKVLWEAWERGTPVMGNESIIEEAGSVGDRLRNVFKEKGGMHPAWGWMIVPARKGSFQLAEPAEPAAPTKPPKRSSLRTTKRPKALEN
jgi:hypothetical protein